MIPHEHTEDLIGVHNESSHHDGHHHGEHQHGDEPESQCLLGIIMDFLGGLDHESISGDHIGPSFADDISIQLAQVDVVPTPVAELFQVRHFVFSSNTPQKFTIPPPLLYQAPDPGDISQRGPPSPFV